MGNGNSISVWAQTWIVDKDRRMNLMKNIFVNLELKVSYLIDSIETGWMWIS